MKRKSNRIQLATAACALAVAWTALAAAPAYEPEDADDPEGYCNRVSRDNEDSMTPENDISGDGEFGAMGGSPADGNAISRWPCKKEPTT